MSFLRFSSIAARQSLVTGRDHIALTQDAIDIGVAAVKSNKDHLVMSAVLRTARSKVLESLPLREDVVAGAPVKIEIDIAALRSEEDARFVALTDAKNWDGLLARYPVRESPAFGRVVNKLGMTDEAFYRAAVLKLLQDEPQAVTHLRSLLGDLPSQIDAA